jgi:hypothetical protein
MTMRRLKMEIQQKCPKWGFLTHILGEHREPRPTMGVNARGVVLVNPLYARQLGIKKLVRLIRAELVLADELAKNVTGFRSR